MEVSTGKLLRCSLLRWKIRDPELHQRFRAKYPTLCLAPAKVYSAFCFLFSICLMFTYLEGPLTLGFYFYFTPMAVATLLGISCFLGWTKPYMELLLTIAVGLLVVWNGAMCYINAAVWHDSYMAGKFTAPNYSEDQIASINDMATEFISVVVVFEHAALAMPNFIAMLYLSVDQALIVLSLASYACGLLLSAHCSLAIALIGLLFLTLFSVFYFFIAFYFKRALVLHYLTELQLESNLEASQKADSILNHS